MSGRDRRAERDTDYHPSLLFTSGATSRGRRRLQLGLGDWIALVISVGITLGLARFMAWEVWLLQFNLPVLAPVLLAVWLVATLLSQVFHVASHKVDPSGIITAPTRLSLTGLVAWRVFASAMLVTYIVEQWHLLASKLQGPTKDTRSEVLPVCGMLLMCGILTGMTSKQRRSGNRTPRTTSWQELIMVWGLVVAVSIAALPDVGLIPYLVLNAIEAVACATPLWDGSGPGVLLRLSDAALPAALAATACLISAVAVAYDLRQASNDRRDRVMFSSWRPVALRLTVITIAVVLAGFLLFVTIPRVHEQLAQGIWLAIGPVEIVIVVVGLAGLSAGLAATALSCPWRSERPSIASYPQPPMAKVGVSIRRVCAHAGLGLLLLGVIVIAAVSTIPTSVLAPLPAHFLSLLAGIKAFWDWVSWNILGYMLYRGLVLLWLFIQAVQFYWARTRPRPGPFDTLVIHRGILLRFLGFWLMLTVLMLTSLPVLCLNSLVLCHYAAMLANWLP